MGLRCLHCRMVSHKSKAKVRHGDTVDDASRKLETWSEALSDGNAV